MARASVDFVANERRYNIAENADQRTVAENGRS